MAWSIRLAARAEKDIAQLGQDQRKRILRFLHDRVAKLDDPKLLGKPMSGEAFRDLWTYRVGDYRLLCSFEDDVMLILVARVGHRREIYDRLSR